MNYISGEEALKIGKSVQRVFVHGGAATPQVLERSAFERSHTYEFERIVY